MDDMKKWLKIGLFLIVAWIVLKVIFKLVGFAFHLLLIGGLIFIVYSVIKYLMGSGQRRQY